jgi:hypothetical protein
MISQTDIELFDDYANNELSEVEKKAFDTRLITDDKFKADYYKYLVGVQVVRLAGVKRDLEFMNASHHESKVVRLKRFVWIPLAASLLLAIFSWFFWNRTPDSMAENLFRDYYRPYPNILAFRGAENELSKAMEAYSKENFGEAESLLKRVHSSNDTVLFYLAICKLSLSQIDSSLLFFKRINSNSVFKEQVNWYRGLAFLRKGNDRLTIESFEKIKSEQFQYVESREIIEKIQKRID